MQKVIFSTFAEEIEGLRYARVLAESLRTFAGRFRNAPIWLYGPASLLEEEQEILGQLASLHVEARTSQVPAEALRFYFARKVSAAAAAEEAAEGSAEILAWMDEDTIVLREPVDLLLDDGISLGYRPVMHQNIGSLYAEPPDAFWSRVYEDLSVPESALFPMRAVADGKVLRPYFNAGLLAVRPERGLLRQWAASFPKLYQDPPLVEMCRNDVKKNIFLHQAALVGAILKLLQREEMVELPDRYNYPIFFKEMFGGEREFHSLDDAVTLRHEGYFDSPAPDWKEMLQGPAEIISWLQERLVEQ